MNRRRRSIAAVVTLILVPACGSQGTTEQATRPPRPSATTTAAAAATGSASSARPTEVAPSPTAREPAPAVETDVPPDEPQTSGGQEPASGGSAPGPPTSQSETETTAASAFVPRQPGTYRYDTDGTMSVTGGDTRPLPKVTTLAVRPASDSQQHGVRDVRDEEGRGQVSDTAMLYRQDGVFLVSVEVTTDVGGGVRDVRAWRPAHPELLVTTGAEPGYRRQFRMRNSDTTADVTVQVLRREPVSVEGQPLETVVTEIHIELSGALEGSQTTTSWMRPGDLLPVQERFRSDVRNGLLRVQLDYDAKLASTRPS